MGYGELPLDEIPTDMLVKELERRRKALDTGTCPYCGHPLDNHACRYAHRILTVYGRGTITTPVLSGVGR